MSTLPGIFLELIVRFLRHIEMKRASQTSLLGESAPAPQTRAELEAAAQVFDLIKDRIQSIEQLNLDVTKMQRAYRSNLFAGWLQNSDQVNLLRANTILASTDNDFAHQTAERFLRALDRNDKDSVF